jgi:hypothetical protein
MRSSIVLLLLASIASVFATGCASLDTFPSVAFEPRVYAYVPDAVAAGQSTGHEAK